MFLRWFCNICFDLSGKSSLVRTMSLYMKCSCIPPWPPPGDDDDGDGDDDDDDYDGLHLARFDPRHLPPPVLSWWRAPPVPRPRPPRTSSDALSRRRSAWSRSSRCPSSRWSGMATCCHTDRSLTSNGLSSALTSRSLVPAMERWKWNIEQQRSWRRGGGGNIRNEVGSIHTCLGVWQGCRLRSLPSSAIPQFLPVSRVSAICFSTSPPISFRKYGQLRSKQWSGGQDQHYMLIFKNWTHVRDCDAGPRKKNVHRCRDRFTRALQLSIQDLSGYFTEFVTHDYVCDSLLIWPVGWCLQPEWGFWGIKKEWFW